MKYIIKSTIAFLVGILLYSCKDLIEVERPASQVTSSSVFEERSTANAALADIYSRIREEGVVTGNSFGGTVLMANYCDELTYYGTNVNIEQFAKHTILPSNTYINTIWRATYSQIYAINAFLEGVRKSSKLTELDRNRFMGEALFLRAYLHFYLVNMYGEIPYVTTTDYVVNTKIPKATIPQVYNQILKDLIQAKSIIPDTYYTAERVRPNKSVVSAMLARVYLYREDWQNAKLNATEVINNNLYKWQDNIRDEFLKTNLSIIWALHPGVVGLNTRDAKSYAFTSGPPTRSVLSSQLLDSYEFGDLRKMLWITTITNKGSTWSHVSKYKLTTTTTTSTEYTILFRLAEMYLIRAEANIKLNDLDAAKSDLNKIRKRAGLPDVTVGTTQELLVAIAKERQLEFFTEQSHRFFDLKRTAKADEVLSLVKPNWKSNHIILPLPENELLVNDKLLPQNNGY